MGLNTIFAMLIIVNCFAEPKTYTNQWSIEVKPGVEVHLLNQLAKKHGFENKGHVIGNVYLFVSPTVKSTSKRKAFHVYRSVKGLEKENLVLRVSQQTSHKRYSRSIVDGSCEYSHERIKRFDKLRRNPKPLEKPNDPMFDKMWYISKPDGLKIKEAWNLGYTGKGVVISVLDDGLEVSHPDLQENFDPWASYDMNDNDADPTPKYNTVHSHHHGTRCAGEIAATFNNSVCIVGVAFNAKVGGIKLLSGELTDVLEAASLSYNRHYIDIYSNSWGPDDGGSSYNTPYPLTRRAFKEGVGFGRNGRGSIYVWASGNGGRNGDNCNCDGYANTFVTLTVSAATENGNIPEYSEVCSATLATVYSSGGCDEKSIVTTDIGHKCTTGHNSTSAAAPIAAAIIALALEANPRLTWRDVQHIVVRTSRPANLKDPDWRKNGAGHSYSNYFGFGLMNALNMVQLARHWRGSSTKGYCVVHYENLDVIIKEKSTYEQKLVVNPRNAMCTPGVLVMYIEYVSVSVTVHVSGKRGDIWLNLTSPAGTTSRLLTVRPKDQSTMDIRDWSFGTVHMWGERPGGVWTLTVGNVGCAMAKLNHSCLTYFGTRNQIGPFGDEETDDRPVSDSFCCSWSPLGQCSACSHSRMLHKKRCRVGCPKFHIPVSDALYQRQQQHIDTCQRLVCQPCPNFCSKCRTMNPEERCEGECPPGWTKILYKCRRFAL